MNRRGFVRSLSLSGLIPAISPLAAESTEGATAGRTRIDLNGVWERWVEGTLFDTVSVPSSLPPLGAYRLKRTFVLPRLARGERAFVRFEAITYFARVSVNGTEIGTMGPYVPYEFEFTSLAREKINQIEVAIADIHAGPDGAGAAEIELGANHHGWEAYGGIIRDAWVEIRPAHFIENVQFAYGLEKDFTSAKCRARLFVSALHSTHAKVTATLAFGHAEVARV